jgi:GT2 family glycosyltransferase
MKSVCLAILNYNGRKHLEYLLPTACAAAGNYAGRCSVLVLDNRSTDDDVVWLKREFPEVEVIVAPQNDFLFSYNWLAERRDEDILVFLNNDLKLHLDFVVPLVRHFALDDVFAVTATSRDWDDQIFTCGPSRLRSHHGMYWWDYDRDRQELRHTLFCCGGFMAVDRNKFIALGGFNRLFHPAYGEDVDLSFRAWRKGWRCLFEPASLVLHRENGSWSQSGASRPARLFLRAQLLFQWGSLPPAAPWLERNAFLLLTAWRELRCGKAWWLFVWLATEWEWLGKRTDYRWMMVSRDELDLILQRIDEPVRPSGQTLQ